MFIILLCSYIMTYSLQAKYFLFMIICSYVLIDSFIVGKVFIFMLICSSVFIDSFIVGKVFIFMTLNRPIYVGFANQDLSKTLMYEFHYNYIKQRYPDSALLFTNTDFLTYQIQMDNVYEDFYADLHLFDFSGYEKESSFYNDQNKKVISKMKDELNCEVIEEFVGLRVKMY